MEMGPVSTAPTTSSADAAVCSGDSTCTAPCDACCVDYLPDQANCNACIEQQCSDKTNICTDDLVTCNVCYTCCVNYLPDQVNCDKCVEEQC